MWAAFFNFVAAFVFGTAVAKTISAGLVDPEQVTQYVILAALGGAICWDLITWWLGLPTSSSHALIGGLAGAGVAKAGWHVLVREPKLHLPFIVTQVLCAWFFALIHVFDHLAGRESAPKFSHRIFTDEQWNRIMCFTLSSMGS